jgi:sulfide dehydrogenase cytochrome subunit
MPVVSIGAGRCARRLHDNDQAMHDPRASHIPVVFLSLSLLALGAGSVRANTLLSSCYACHGPDGVSHGDHMPTIAGLNYRYFYGSMQAFRKGRRKATIMDRIARGYSSVELQMMAIMAGRKPWTGRAQPVDPALAERGRRLHDAACVECHERNGHYQDKEIPPLAGQARGYLFNQMVDYRVADIALPQPPLMQEQLEKLSDEDLAALSAFYASRPAPESGAAAGADAPAAAQE